MHILMCLTAGNAAWYRGGVEKAGIEDILVLPPVTVVYLLPGPALRDGFSHVLALRIVVPEALRRLSGQLLRQRQSGPLQTLRRPCGQLLRQRQFSVSRRCGTCFGSGNLLLRRRCGVSCARDWDSELTTWRSKCCSAPGCALLLH